MNSYRKSKWWPPTKVTRRLRRWCGRTRWTRPSPTTRTCVCSARRRLFSNCWNQAATVYSSNFKPLDPCAVQILALQEQETQGNQIQRQHYRRSQREITRKCKTNELVAREREHGTGHEVGENVAKDQQRPPGDVD